MASFRDLVLSFSSQQTCKLCVVVGWVWTRTAKVKRRPATCQYQLPLVETVTTGSVSTVGTLRGRLLVLMNAC